MHKSNEQIRKDKELAAQLHAERKEKARAFYSNKRTCINRALKGYPYPSEAWLDIHQDLDGTKEINKSRSGNDRMQKESEDFEIW